MSETYKFNRPVYLPRLKRFSNRRRLLFLCLLIVAATAAWILWDLRHLPRAKPDTSPLKIISTDAQSQTYRTNYFEFSDNQDKWQFDQNDSTANKFIFVRYHGKEPQHSISVYVNQMPTSLYLATSRVLPVTLKGNGVLAGQTSGACGQAYGSQPPRIMTITISGASMLCDPDTGAYTVVAAQVGGDYNLRLKRPDGSTANYIIIYQNLMFSPEPGVFERLINTFQTL